MTTVNEPPKPSSKQCWCKYTWGDCMELWECDQGIELFMNETTAEYVIYTMYNVFIECNL